MDQKASVYDSQSAGLLRGHFRGRRTRRLGRTLFSLPSRVLVRNSVALISKSESNSMDQNQKESSSVSDNIEELKAKQEELKQNHLFFILFIEETRISNCFDVNLDECHSKLQKVPVPVLMTSLASVI